MALRIVHDNNYAVKNQPKIDQTPVKNYYAYGGGQGSNSQVMTGAYTGNTYKSGTHSYVSSAEVLPYSNSLDFTMMLVHKQQTKY